MKTTTLVKKTETESYQSNRPEAHRMGFYERIFFKGLQASQRGKLRITYTNGTEKFVGQGSLQLGEIQIKDRQFFRHVVLYGDIGLGEAWFLGYWDSQNLHSVLAWFVNNSSYLPTFAGPNIRAWIVGALSIFNKIGHWMRPNSISQARLNISKHYDLSNDFFELMLDKSMTYSAACFQKDSDSLYEAQMNKYSLLCQKLQLKPGDHLLEIGSGWGGLAIHAAQNYGCRVTTVTISEEQYKYAKDRIESAGLQDQIIICLQDYRLIQGQFDKIISIEMLEAVGHKYMDTFFKKCDELLAPEGLLALQCINFPDSHYKSYIQNVDFIQKHIFPGGELVSTTEILNSLNRTGNLMLQDLESMGQHYAKTLWLWQQRFKDNRSQIEALGFDAMFIRKWYYYLVFCEIGFVSNYINTIQILLSRPQNPSLKNFHSTTRSFSHV